MINILFFLFSPCLTTTTYFSNYYNLILLLLLPILQLTFPFVLPLPHCDHLSLWPSPGDSRSAILSFTILVLFHNLVEFLGYIFAIWLTFLIAIWSAILVIFFSILEIYCQSMGQKANRVKGYPKHQRMGWKGVGYIFTIFALPFICCVSLRYVVLFCGSCLNVVVNTCACKVFLFLLSLSTL